MRHPTTLLLLSLLLVMFSGSIQAQQTLSCPNSNATILLTTRDALGPFYVENSETTNILAPRQLLIDPSNVFTVQGQVIGNNCIPLANAIVEAWYAGEELFYQDDLFRGQVQADNCGNYRFTQTFPAVYPSRPIPHIHYRVSTPDNQLLLITQLYFEGVIPLGYNPDETKISTITQEPDGSRKALFNVYVNVPGTANMEVCGDDTTTTNNNNNTTTATTQSEGMEPISDLIADETLFQEEPQGEPCGDIMCDPGLECCNESCGTCVPPGGVCRMIACVGPAPAPEQEQQQEETEMGSAMSRAEANMFD